MNSWGVSMDFYKRGLGAITPITIGQALVSIRGTRIETIEKNSRERCSTCKFYTPVANKGLGGCTLWSKKVSRPVHVHESWYCAGFVKNPRSTGLGSATQKALLTDSRSVVPGDAPWSRLGEYGNNVKLQHGGKPFAIINFGNSIRTTIREGAQLPISDIFEIKSLGEKNGTWTIEITTDVTDGYFDNMLKQANYQFRFTMVPQVYSSVPLNIQWSALDEALYDKVSGRNERVRKEVVRRGHDYVPAGRVADLTGLLHADVERPPFAKEGTENHRITRRMVLKVRCRHG